MKTENIPASAKRVRENTPSEINREIDRLTLQNVEKYSGSPDHVITQHLHDLDKEWDIERTLEMNMSIIALSGVLLTAFVSKKWLILPAVVLGFFLQHALQGWCPPLSVFRRFKVRTRSEIEQEKYSLKALRGDFIGVENGEESLKSTRRY